MLKLQGASSVLQTSQLLLTMGKLRLQLHKMGQQTETQLLGQLNIDFCSDFQTVEQELV